jgi:hypothetical protein
MNLVLVQALGRKGNNHLVCPESVPFCTLSLPMTRRLESLDFDARSKAGWPGLTARGRRICSWVACPFPFPGSAEEDILHSIVLYIAIKKLISCSYMLGRP